MITQRNTNTSNSEYCGISKETRSDKTRSDKIRSDKIR